MEVNFTRLFGIVLTSVIATMFWTVPALAKGDYYVNADSGDDSNSCTSVAEACKTIVGVKAIIIAAAKPEQSTIHLAGTFTEVVSFASSDVTAPDTLDGLRITSIDTDSPATIDGTGNDDAVIINGVNDLLIDNINVTGSVRGIYLLGSSTTLMSSPTIRNVTIHDLSLTDSDDTYQTGIYLMYTKNAIILNSTVRDLVMALTDASSYHSQYGIYSYLSENITIRNTTVTDLTATHDATAAGNSHWTYQYGIYHFGAVGITIKQSTVSNFSAIESGSIDSAIQRTITNGVYVSDTADVRILNSTISNLTSAVNLTGDITSGSATIAGMSIFRPRHVNLKQSVVKGNTISDLTPTTSVVNGSSATYGMDIDTAHGISVTKNQLSNLDPTVTSAVENSSNTAIIYGVDVGSSSVDAVVSSNRLSDCNSTVTYNGVSGQSGGNMYGFITNGTRFTVKKNRVSNCSVTINNSDSAEYYDYGTIAGIYSTSLVDSVVSNNTIDMTDYSSSSAGTGGFMSYNHYGIYLNFIEGVTVKKNTVDKGVVNAIVNDATNSTYAYYYVYPLSIGNASNVTVDNNRIKNITASLTGANNNYLVTYFYGIYFNGSSGVRASRNRLTNISSTTGSAVAGFNYFYGIYSYFSPGARIDGTSINTITVDGNGTSGTTNLLGIVLYNSADNYVSNTRFRNAALTSDNAASDAVYGIYLSNDNSGTRLYNNVLLGEDTYTSGSYYGIYARGASNHGVYMYNNTLSRWVYPLLVEGGSKLRLRNNVLAAQGGDGYSLAVAYDGIDRDTFVSNYNLFYNSTAADQLVYDRSNTTAVAWADWRNQGGSWGYDGKSVKGNPKLNAKGYLQKGSKAMNRGTKNYGVSKTSYDYAVLRFDIQGDRRLSSKKSKVDIGADEYKK